jgi:predicted dehydrogenase
MEVTTMKVGIIGTGSIANSHVRHGWAALKDDGVEVVAAADIVPGKAAEFAQRYDIPYAYEDYHELLEMGDVDAVSICTYNQAHRQPTVDALQAGKHVLVEKPMATFLDDAVAMVRAAHETGKILMCGIKSRYSAEWIAARNFARAGALGDIYYVQASGGRRRGVPGRTFVRKDTAGGGIVVDGGVYTIDNVMWVLGHPKPVSVTATTNSYVGKLPGPQPEGAMWQWDPDQLEVEDFGAAWIRFEDGTVFAYMGAWAHHMEGMGGTYFLGTHGGLKMRPFELYHDQAGYMVKTTPGLTTVDPPGQFKAEIAAFAEAIRDGLPAPIPPEEVLLVNVVMQGIYDSAAAGHEIEVTIPAV